MPRNSSLSSMNGSLRSSLRLKGAPAALKEDPKGKVSSSSQVGLKRKGSVLEDPVKGVKGSKRAVFEDITNVSSVRARNCTPLWTCIVDSQAGRFGIRDETRCIARMGRQIESQSRSKHGLDPIDEAMSPKRQASSNAQANEHDRKSNLKSTVRKGLTSIRSNFGGGVGINKRSHRDWSQEGHSQSPEKTATVTTLAAASKRTQAPSARLIEQKKRDESHLLQLQQSGILSRTSSYEDAKCMEGVSLSDAELDASLEAFQASVHASASHPPEGVKDFDLENAQDPNQCSLYAAQIFAYYKSREEQFAVSDYMKEGIHPEINETMRSILVDWLVEVQESFELNHETLYTSVKIFDLYLSLTKRPIKKDELQLIGATACLIACKVDERLPPALDDFVYVCDDAYSREQIIVMERKIIATVKFDVGYPLSYRFLRRYGRVCSVPMSILTLARFILEMSLMEYEFNIVGMSESKLAASSLVLAFKIHGIRVGRKPWPTILATVPQRT
ncbi:Uncharacterized protein FKW44_007015 [Caligus rogercresseyi]|uniref:Cyclin-like domain-containing protein n=1 Tax=Caligus rogercresseyi TaxID=217165 RepID=A0A7T8KE56_CALRO|nr:Uncharacterized protein FKW44_007015 [Caligus rogercresseyi]